MIREIQEQLVNAFSPKTDRALFRAVTEGILLADEHLEVVPFMGTLIGRDLRGLIRRSGVMYCIREYCVRGDLPFQAEYRQMPRGAWHWLEIRSKDTLAHLCRTEYGGAFPEDTPNRQDARLSNQADLFEDNVVLLSSQLYVWLMAGTTRNGVLTHLCWGAPAAKNDSWLAYRNVLSGIAVTPMKPSPPPSVSPKDKLRFRDGIQAAIDQSNSRKENDGKE